MVKCVIKEGLWKEVDELLLSMEKYNCSPNSVMLNSVVRGLLEKGKTTKAMEFLYEMNEQTLWP